MDAYAAVFDTWVSAKLGLEHAIKDFVNASAALKNVLSAPPLSPSSRILRESKLAQLDLELQSLPSYPWHIHVSNRRLSLARNTSHALSPISLLPSDVLHMTLSLVAQSAADPYGFINQRTTAIIALSSVCSAWRRLMLSSAGFWTNIDIVLLGSQMEPYYRIATLWAERSRDAVLDLLIMEQHSVGRARSRSLHWDHRVVDSLVTALLARTHTLHIRSRFQSSRTGLHSILDRWAALAPIGMAERLCIWDDEYKHLSVERIPQNRHQTTDRFTHFFRSLRFLDIQAPWESMHTVAHARLVELHISNVYSWSLTARSICDILAQTPQLASLKLQDVSIEESNDEARAVTLNHLQTLIFNGNDLWRVWTAIHSASVEIKASLTIVEDPECLIAARSFFSRMSISHLHLIDAVGHTHEPVFTLFTHMPNLVALAIKCFRLDPWLLVVATAGLTADIWPSLQEIYCSDCSASPEALHRLVSIHPPQVLYWHSDWSAHTSLLFDTEMQAATEEAMMVHGVRMEWIRDADNHHFESSETWAYTS